MDLDLDFVRRRFPKPCWDWAFFENAGGSYVPQSVIDRTVAFMSECQVQPHASFAPSAMATERIEAGHRVAAEMIHASPDEVVMGRSTTGNVYVLAQALRPLFKAGDELIVTNLDHEANVGAWRRLAEFGVTIKEWKVDPETATLEVEALQALLTDRTRLVCFAHCSNITGAFNDVARIAEVAHEAGAWVCVDGVAYVAHRPVDVKALDVDFYLFSLYKLYGPHIAALYGKRQRLLEARGQNHFFIGEDEITDKLNPGSRSYESTAAVQGLGDYFDALHKHHFKTAKNSFRARVEDTYGPIVRHEEALASRFVDFLCSKPGVRLIGPATADPARRAPTFAFTVKGRRSAEIPPAAEAKKIAIRNGNFWAWRLLDALGIDQRDGVVRVSMVHYNTTEEVDRLIQALDPVL